MLATNATARPGPIPLAGLPGAGSSPEASAEGWSEASRPACGPAKHLGRPSGRGARPQILCPARSPTLRLAAARSPSLPTWSCRYAATVWSWASPRCVAPTSESTDRRGRRGVVRGDHHQDPGADHPAPVTRSRRTWTPAMRPGCCASWKPWPASRSPTGHHQGRKYPQPCSARTSPSAASFVKTRRTVVRPASRVSARCRSEGRRSPGFSV